MIDIHSHILPCVDDGSVKVENSLSILKSATEQSVKDIILTPHYRGRYKESREHILQAFNSFKSQVVESGIDVNLYLGQEIYVEKDYRALINSNTVLSLANGKYVLIEFDFDYECDIVNVAYELALQGYKPIVAHLERYGYVDQRTAYEIRQVGGYIQINADSIVKPKSFRKKRFIKWLFKENLVDFVASDAHYNRKYLMKKAYKKVKRRFGKDTAQAVFCTNAKEILQGQS